MLTAPETIACDSCGSPTILNTDGEFAGIWECINDECGESGEHEHEDLEIETVEVDTMRNGEHDTYKVRVYICPVCHKTLDDPVEPEEPEYERDDE